MAVDLKKAGGLVILIIIIAGVLSCWHEVSIGHVGVQYDPYFGAIKDKELSAGGNLKAPWVDVYEFDVRSQVYTMTATPGEGQVADDDSISTLTSEGLKIDMDMSVQYRVLPSAASDILAGIGPDYEDKIVRPGIKSVIREVTAKHTALEVYGDDRTVVAAEMQDALEKSVESEGIIIEKVLIRDVRLPDKIKDAIDAKMQAAQDAERMVFVNQAKELEAEGRRIDAQGKADARLIEATSEAEAIDKVTAALARSGDTYVNLEYVKVLGEQEITTMIVPAGSTPIIGSIA